MDVTWAATSPSSGRFVPSEVTTDLGALERQFHQLRSRGSGYLEVRLSDTFPVITLGFNGEVAVVHLMPDGGTTNVLVADDPRCTSPATVPIMDDLTEFTTEFVHDLGQAWVGVLMFARTGAAAALGRWHAI